MATGGTRSTASVGQSSVLLLCPTRREDFAEKRASSALAGHSAVGCERFKYRTAGVLGIGRPESRRGARSARSTGRSRTATYRGRATRTATSGSGVLTARARLRQTMPSATTLSTSAHASGCRGRCSLETPGAVVRSFTGPGPAIRRTEQSPGDQSDEMIWEAEVEGNEPAMDKFATAEEALRNS